MSDQVALVIDNEKEHEFQQILSPSTQPVKSAPTYKYAFSVRNQLLRECLAEIFGTFVLILFGDGVVAQVVLSGGKNGDYTHINLCWGLGVLFGIHACGGVSGAHLNPAVTFGLAMFKRFEWRKAPFYMLSQVIGAFLGALVVYLVYYPALNVFDPERTVAKTAGIFATYPQKFESTGSAFFDEMVGTAILMMGIFAIGDQKNQPASKFTSPVAVALLVVAIGMAFGYNTGYAINPARDFGPRLFTAVGGWGSEVFTAANNYWWVPIVGPLVGAVVGCGLYTIFIEAHHPTEADE